jgi:hypothetical protein
VKSFPSFIWFCIEDRAKRNNEFELSTFHFVSYFDLTDFFINMWKVVVNQFSRVGANERCSFFGNVSLGKDISLVDLRKLYHVVLLSLLAVQI